MKIRTRDGDLLDLVRLREVIIAVQDDLPDRDLSRTLVRSTLALIDCVESMSEVKPWALQIDIPEDLNDRSYVFNRVRELFRKAAGVIEEPEQKYENIHEFKNDPPR